VKKTEKRKKLNNLSKPDFIVYISLRKNQANHFLVVALLLLLVSINTNSSSALLVKRFRCFSTSSAGGAISLQKKNEKKSAHAT
jgi:hypothetical protein